MRRAALAALLGVPMSHPRGPSEQTPREVLVSLVIILASIPWWAFVAQKLWTWYALPLGAPRVGFWTLIGVATAFRFMFGSHHIDYKEPLSKDAGRAVMLPLVALGMCAFYRWLAS